MSVSACVNCQNEEVEKVSSVYNSGTWSASKQGTRHGVRWDKKGRPIVTTEPYTEHAKGATRLAEMLAPPEEPTNAAVVVIILACIGLLCFLWFLAVLVLEGLLGWTGSSLAGIVLAVVALSVLYDPAKRLAERQAEQFQKKHALWKLAMDRWESLYYCSRCDQVFDPATGKSASPRKMSSLL